MAEPLTAQGWISSQFKPLRWDFACGKVLMVNSAGLYFELKDEIFLICPARFGVIPIGISVEQYEDLVAQFCIQKGQQVSLSAGNLHFPGGILSLRYFHHAGDASRQICIPNFLKWQRAMQTLAACDRSEGLAGLLEPLFFGASLESSANILCRYGLPAMEALLESFLTQCPEKIPPAVRSLLGLGIGLTPSGDDVLNGLLYALQRSALQGTQLLGCLAETVMREAPERTNRISNAYLQATAAGAEFERIGKAWFGLDARFPDEERGLLEIGSSSGKEMLLGLLVAGKIVMHF